MIDIKEKDILDIIFELTHIKDEEGNDVPHFCFASDLAMDLDAKEEELAVIAAKNNYKIYKVFPGETMIGGIVFVADGATIEPVETMYKEFYGEVPEIIELKLDDEDNLVEVEEQTEDLDFDLIEPPTIEDKLGDYTSYMDNYKKLASELGAEIEFRTKVGPKRLDSVWYGDLYIATIKYGDWIFDIFGSGDYPYITVDGETFEYDNVWLAPSMKGKFYGGGMMIAPSQDRKNKTLSVVIYKCKSIYDIKAYKSFLFFLLLY